MCNRRVGEIGLGRDYAARSANNFADDMIRLPQSLGAWQTPDFNHVLKEEVARLDASLLPLQQGLLRTSHVTSERPTVVVHGVTDESGRLRVKAGLFYTGIIAGCSCADDPTPIDEVTEYCEVLFVIDKQTAEATVTLLDGD